MNLSNISTSSASPVVKMFTGEDTEQVRFSTSASHDVQVWQVALNQNTDSLFKMNALLSLDERLRADRYHFAKDRNQFVESRAALRLILSDYLNTTPQKIEFVYGPCGKPALAGEFSESKLRFNLSRRDGLALIVVAY